MGIKLSYFIIGLFLIGFASAGFGIVTTEQAWTPTHVSGEEAGLTLWSVDAKDKKTELGWIPKSGNCTGWIDKVLEYSNGDSILDDKNKSIILKCESAKCAGEDCYYVSLTDVQAINIDDNMKLGNNSYAIKYQNISMVEYTKTTEIFNETTNETLSTQDFQVNVTLRKLIGGEFIINPENIFISQPDNNTFKFGAIDYDTEINEIYKYTWESDEEIWKYNNEYFIGGEVISMSTQFQSTQKTINSNNIDLSDICGDRICLYNLTFNNQTNISKLDVEFTGIFNETTNDTFIDPSFSLGDREWTSTSAAIFNNTGVSNGIINITNSSLNGTFSRVIELKTYEASNRTGLVGEWLFSDGLATDTSGLGNDGTLAGGLTSCNANGIYELYGQSCDYDGVDNKISINNLTPFNSSVGTISFWTYQVDNEVANAPISFSNSQSSTRTELIPAFDWGAGDDHYTFFITIDGVSQWVYQTDANFMDAYSGKWVNIVIVQDGIAPSFYINGLPMPVNAITTTNTAAWIGDLLSATTPSDVLTFGLNQRDIINSPFDGQVTNIRFYNRTLGTDEIYANYLGNSTDDLYIKNMSCEASDSDKVLWMHFDQDVQSIADFSGEGNVGTRVGTTYNDSCIIGGCLDFESDSGDYMKFDNNDDLNFGADDFTISLWTKKESVGEAYNDLIANHDSSSGWTIERGTNNLYRFFWYVGGFQSTPYFNITIGEWNQIVITGNASDVKVYKNNILLSTTNRVGTIADQTSYLPMISGLPQIPTDHNYDGLVDEVIIKKGTAMSVEEINASYQAGLLGLVYEGNNSETTVRFRTSNNLSINVSDPQDSDFTDWTDYQTCSLDQDLSSIIGSTATKYVQYETFMSTTNVSYPAQLNFLNLDYDNESAAPPGNLSNITLISPINEFTTELTNIDFEFNISDEDNESITWTLFIDDVQENTGVINATTIPTNIQTTIVGLSVANHTWYVTAKDNSTATSETRWFEITPKTVSDNILELGNSTSGNIVINFTKEGGGIFTDDINLSNSEINDVLKIHFNLTNCNTGDDVPGTLCHNIDDDTLEYYTTSGQTIQFGRELSGLGKNAQGSFLPDGSVVALVGYSGDNRIFVAADSTNISLSSLVGVLTTDCDSNEICPVTVFGDVRDINTSAWNAGDMLWINPGEPGNLTNIKPDLPNNPIVVGYAGVIHDNVGTLFAFPGVNPLDGFLADSGWFTGNLTVEENLNVSGNISLGENLSFSNGGWISNTIFGVLDFFTNVIIHGNLTVDGIITGEPVVGEIWTSASLIIANSTEMVGTSFVGTVANLSDIDNSYTIIREKVAAPGFTQVYNFTEVNTLPGRFDWVGYYYPCSTSHNVKVYFWNYTGAAWVAATAEVRDILCGISTENTEYNFQYPVSNGDFISGGNVSVMISHDNNGNINHYFGTDYVELEQKDLAFEEAGVYYNASGGMEGLNNYVTVNASDVSMIIQINGTYKTCTALSFSGSSDTTIHGDVFVNGEDTDKVSFTRKLGSSGDVGSAGMCGLLNLTVGDEIDIRFESDKEGWIHFQNGNFNIHRLN